MSNSQQSPSTHIGHLIGSAFGLVFVIANSGSLAAPVRSAAILLAGLAVAFVVISFLLSIRGGAPPPGRGERFDARYLIVVGVEVVALFGGPAILRPIEPTVTLGWIALVVGLHFLPFARLWPRGRTQFLVIGAALAVLGALGLVLAFTTRDEHLVDLVAGVGSGIALLALGVASGFRRQAVRSHGPGTGK